MRIEKRNNEEKPWMDEESEGKFIQEMLNITGKHIDVLEWGLGFSTRYFTAILRSKNIEFEWDAIEYDIDWYIFAKKWGLENVNLFLFQEELPDDKQWMRGREMNEYVDFPKTRGKKYDLMFVDGRKRVRCLEIAKDYLKENGIVILHDAQRQDYHEGFKYYKGQFLTETLWKGKLK